MRLWIGLHLPQLPLEVFCPNWSPDKDAANTGGMASATVAVASVVLEQQCVLACSGMARAAGVRVGMRRAGVQMLAPDAILHERDPAREEQALNDVAMALLQYSPLLAAAEESTLLIDIGASLRLFGGIRRLCRLVRRSMRTLGLSAALSCAPTARGAWLLARGGGGFVLSMRRLVARLGRLPTRLLPPARPYLDWLDGIGCHALGDLRRLPRAGLQRRCGKPVLQMLDCAHGEAPECFEWIAAPPHFRARLELFDRVEHAEALLYVAKRLLLQMTGWLSARQMAVGRVTLCLEHERGREALPHTVLEIVLAEATWRDEHLLRLLKERLGQLSLSAPVIAVALEAAQVEAMAPLSDSLFPEPGGTAEDHQRLLEVLVARLGPENVLQAAPKADYRPEVANAWVPVLEKVKPGAGLPTASAALALPRPAWLLAKPIALLMRNHRPFYGSPLRMASPPERIEAGWWNGELVTRDYYVAEGQDHVCYWVYRERIGGAENADPKWYLHGLFG